ncbi:MAG: hypothetical protein M1574_05925 [Gammaproteobacteria bacterium]|jgi:hypothetical protein|nr:hypothetical protein [Gammaproteobacteria bacterium]
MKRTHLCWALVPAAFALLVPAAIASTPAIHLSRLMSEHAYRKAGLSRLSPGEREALESWIAQHLKALVIAARPNNKATARFGLPHPEFPSMPSRITSHLKGVFTGWSGHTRFRLRNGEVWVQDGYGSFSTPALHDPRVVIKKLLVGYVLRVPPYGAEVFVRRVR